MGSRDQWAQILKEETDANTKVILAGFSQGAAMSLYTSATAPIKNLVGVVSMAGWMPECAKIQGFPDVPVLQVHGVQDEMVPFSAAEQTKEVLERVGAPEVKLLSYDIAHTANRKMTTDVEMFYRTLIPEE